MEKVLAIVMAGGAGERLQPLTRERSKASVPFGGKYRLIDITLSNCVNSGLRRIFVLTQYLSESLNRHIQDGWPISSSGLGDFIYNIPAQMKMGTTWYRGTADAVRQNMNLISNQGFEDIVILSGDHVYKMNHFHMIEYHRQHKAALTIAALRVKLEDASGRLGVLEEDKDNRAIGFEEKPINPKTIPNAQGYCLASMGIYIFKVKNLLDVLYGEGEDFGKHIIPRMIRDMNNIYVYDYEQENRITDYEIRVTKGVREKILIDSTRDSSYWRDVGTIDSFYEASMDLVSIDPAFSLYSEKWPLRTLQRQLPPCKCTLGGKIVDSILSDGCIISGGTVEQSVLSPGVIVEQGAWVNQSVVFDNVLIEPGAKINRAIIDKECRIRSGALIGFDHASDKARGCTVSENGIVVVPKGTEIQNNGLHLL